MTKKSWKNPNHHNPHKWTKTLWSLVHHSIVTTPRNYTSTDQTHSKGLISHRPVFWGNHNNDNSTSSVVFCNPVVLVMCYSQDLSCVNAMVHITMVWYHRIDIINANSTMNKKWTKKKSTFALRFLFTMTTSTIQPSHITDDMFTCHHIPFNSTSQHIFSRHIFNHISHHNFTCSFSSLSHPLDPKLSQLSNLWAASSLKSGTNSSPNHVCFATTLFDLLSSIHFHWLLRCDVLMNNDMVVIKGKNVLSSTWYIDNHTVMNEVNLQSTSTLILSMLCCDYCTSPHHTLIWIWLWLSIYGILDHLSTEIQTHHHLYQDVAKDDKIQNFLHSVWYWSIQLDSIYDMWYFSLAIIKPPQHPCNNHWSLYSHRFLSHFVLFSSFFSSLFHSLFTSI